MTVNMLRVKFLFFALISAVTIFFFSAPVHAIGVPSETQGSVSLSALTYKGSISDGVVTNFHSNILLDKKGNAAITEKITVYFPTAKHGIYRWIPNEVIISESGKKFRQPITVHSVEYSKLPTTIGLGINDKSSSYSSSTSSGNYTVLKIGDADTYIEGAYEFTISYSMKNAIRFQKDYQELYLNITGDQWELPILKASASISPKAGVLDTKCYTGAAGSTTSFCSSSLQGESYEFITTTTANVAAEGLTVALKFSDGTFTGPTALELLLAFMLPLLPLFLPLAAFAYGYSTWKKYGKDISLFAIPPIFIPTKEMETESLTIQSGLLAMKAKPVETLAELIRIAERGFLTISYENNEISLKLTPEQQKKLPEFLSTQPTSLRLVIETLTNDYSAETTVNKLKNVYTEIANATKDAATEFKDTPYITDKSENMQRLFVGLAILCAVVTFGFGFFLFPILTLLGLWLLPFATGACMVIFGVFAYGMLKRTKEGDAFYRDLLGLKKYIKTAEVNRLEFFNDPKKMIAHFEQILPYSVILGLDKQWAKEFGPILERLKYEPTWMTSNIPIYNAIPRVYAGMASQMTSSMAKISTPPQSSGSSFGGGGGGGFSGGGSGGGGGGSW